MEYDYKAHERNKRRGFLEESLLKISKELFEIPLYGIGICGITNILFLYLCYKRTTFISLCIFFTLFYLIIKIVQNKILGR